MKVATDLVILRKEKFGYGILLVTRKYPPHQGCYALPGGFVEENEPIYDAAIRELKEETSLDINYARFVGFYDHPDRDPRGRVISFAFAAIIDDMNSDRVMAGDDAATAQFVSLDELDMDNLAFDHQTIVHDAIKLLNLGT